MKNLNTYCRVCGAHTDSKFINKPEQGEIECRCARCGKFKDIYHYSDTPEQNETGDARFRAFVILFALSLVSFAVSAFALEFGTERPVLIGTLIGSIICAVACALVLDRKEEIRTDNGTT